MIIFFDKSLVDSSKANLLQEFDNIELVPVTRNSKGLDLKILSYLLNNDYYSALIESGPICHQVL